MTKRLIILFIIVLSISINGFSQKSIYAPTLIDPANKAENISTFITLRWAPVAGAFYYKVQIDTALLTDKTPAYSTIITPADSIRYLLFGTKYYWRVKSYSEDKKDSSKWSDVFSFTVIYKPELTTPADTATNIKIPLNLTWKTISGTQNYDYQIDLTPKFNTSFKYESSVNGKNNSVSLSSNILEYGKKYYWRVRARHNKSTSDWSNAFSFTTINNITDAPKAFSPENNSNGIGTTVTFKWHPVANAIKYIFQYSLSNNFNSILSSDTITVNSIEKKELLFNNKYYWRIKASNLNNISNWSKIFNFTIIDKPVLLAPDNNLTNSNTDKVTLKWNAINGVNKYICETDINNSFNSDKFKTYLVSNTELNLTKLDNETQYFWRVKAIHSKDSSNYSDIFNFTTLSLKLSSPLLINPKNQSVAEPLSITFNWSKINTANSYRFVLSLNENFDSSLIDSTLSANSIMIENLLYNTLYYWRVKSNNAKDTSDWSVVYNFNTFDKFPALTNIIYPLNNANNINPSLEINWTKIDSATTYILQTDVNPDFSNPLSDTLSTLTKDTSNLNFGSSYYLRIKTSKDTVYSEWSDTVVFTTIVKPILISPSMNLDNVKVTDISLKWANIKGVSAYELQLDNNNQFNSKNLLYVKDIKDSSSVVNNLFYTTTYFWRVRALNAQDTSDWSDKYSFNTIKIVNLLYPANLSQNLSTDLTLEWEALNLADEYYIQVDTSAAFNTSFLKLDSSYGQTQIKITKLMYGKKYYWRVKAKNSFSQSAWSATYNFTTINKLELYYPANNIANTILIPKLMWENASGISNYELEMDTTQKFNSTKLKKYSFDKNIITPDTLEFNTKYYWRVLANNGSYKTQWSDVWSMSTSKFLNLVSPADKTQNAAISLSLKWKFITGSKKYLLQYDTDQKFPYPTSVTVDAKYDFVALKNLLFETTYYWRVKAITTQSESLWSSVWSFTTTKKTGIENNNSIVPFSLYPSITDGNIFINFNNSSNIQEVNFHILNTTGQIVKTFNVTLNPGDNNKVFNIANLQNGLYFIRINNPAINNKGIKFILNK